MELSFDVVFGLGCLWVLFIIQGRQARKLRDEEYWSLFDKRKSHRRMAPRLRGSRRIRSKHEH